MNDKQRDQVSGMDRLLRRFVKYPDNKEFTVEELIKASNEVYEEILGEASKISIPSNNSRGRRSR